MASLFYYGMGNMQPLAKTPLLCDVIIVLLASALVTTMDVIFGLSLVVALGCANIKRALALGLTWGVAGAAIMYFRLAHVDSSDD